MTATPVKRRVVERAGADFVLEGKPSCEIHVGDCRVELGKLAHLRGTVDLVFADPPFNWNRAYDKWDDAMPREDYLRFTEEWLDVCVDLLRAGGSFWVNIPDDTAAEIVVHLKKRGLEMENWCIWHYRFGQNTKSRFINSKVHALWFVKPGGERTWNADAVLEPSDRATTYFDPRTMDKKDGMPAGKRVPMDVWYGRYWGRIQGNNKERRGNHDNQLPEVYLERVIAACSREGDLVVDPFVGSGTTAVMAHSMGRRFIGTEFSRANAKSAFERVKQGPIKRERDEGGTAIFPPRRVGKKTAERLKGE
jgi:adenine-specific DNA-methyltransferase